MTTQVLPLLDPARGTFWAWVAPTAAILTVVMAAVVDHLLERHRNPADVMAVVDIRTARRALARVDRLTAGDGGDQAAAVRHLTSVRTWSRGEEIHGSRRRRMTVAELHATATDRLADLGVDPRAQVDPDDLARWKRRGGLEGLSPVAIGPRQVPRSPDARIWRRDSD